MRRDILKIIGAPFQFLSLKIIIATPSKDDLHITQRMSNWIANPYSVESSDSEEEEDEDNDEEEDDNGEDAEDNEGVDEEEDTSDEEDDFVQGMNSSPRVNKHIHFLVLLYPLSLLMMLCNVDQLHL